MAQINPALLAIPRVNSPAHFNNERAVARGNEARADAIELSVDQQEDLTALSQFEAFAKAGMPDQAMAAITARLEKDPNDKVLKDIAGMYNGQFTEQLGGLLTGIRTSLGGAAPAMPELKLIETVDENGNNVQKFVSEKEGTEFPMVPTAQENKQSVLLTPQEIANAGLQPGTVAQRDANGRVSVVQGPQKSSESEDVRQRKINALTAQGLTKDQAANLVDGHVRQEVTPLGNVVSINDVAALTGDGAPVTEQPIVGGDPEIPAPKPGQTLWDLAPAATGPVQSLTAKTAAALSFFGIETEEPATEAQQAFRTEVRSLIRALSINPRFPVAEQERIREEIDIQPSFFQGAGTLKKKMRSVATTLDTAAAGDRDWETGVNR